MILERGIPYKIIDFLSVVKKRLGGGRGRVCQRYGAGGNNIPQIMVDR
jgi:hypothetical protein